jgi:hypothetical protein
MEAVRIRDPRSGMEKLDPGSGINIPDPPHCWTDILIRQQGNH